MPCFISDDTATFSVRSPWTDCDTLQFGAVAANKGSNHPSLFSTDWSADVSGLRRVFSYIRSHISKTAKSIFTKSFTNMANGLL